MLALGRADQAPDRRLGGVGGLALAGADRSLGEDRPNRGALLGAEVGLKRGERLLRARARGLRAGLPRVHPGAPELGRGLARGLGQENLAPAHFEQAVFGAAALEPAG